MCLYVFITCGYRKHVPNKCFRILKCLLHTSDAIWSEFVLTPEIFRVGYLPGNLQLVFSFTS